MLKTYFGLGMIFLFVVSSTGCGSYYLGGYGDRLAYGYDERVIMQCDPPEIGTDGVPEVVCVRDGHFYRYREGSWYKKTQDTADIWAQIPRPTFATEWNACETLSKEAMVNAMSNEMKKRK